MSEKKPNIQMKKVLSNLKENNGTFTHESKRLLSSLLKAGYSTKSISKAAKIAPQTLNKWNRLFNAKIIDPGMSKRQIKKDTICGQRGPIPGGKSVGHIVYAALDQKHRYTDIANHFETTTTNIENKVKNYKDCYRELMLLQPNIKITKGEPYYHE